MYYKGIAQFKFKNMAGVVCDGERSEVTSALNETEFLEHFITRVEYNESNLVADTLHAKVYGPFEAVSQSDNVTFDAEPLIARIVTAGSDEEPKLADEVKTEEMAKVDAPVETPKEDAPASDTETTQGEVSETVNTPTDPSTSEDSSESSSDN